LILKRNICQISISKKFSGNKRKPLDTRFYWVEEKQKRLFLCIILLFIYQVLLLLFAKKKAKETIGICFFFLFEEKVVDVFVSGWSTSFSLVVAPAGATVCCASA